MSPAVSTSQARLTRSAAVTWPELATPCCSARRRGRTRLVCGSAARTVSGKLVRTASASLSSRTR
jgi:hypothetical protein